MSEELKPCPFCGESDNISFIYVGYVFTRHQVECMNCHAGTGIKDTKKLAIKAWNARAYTQQLSELQDRAKELEGELKTLSIKLASKGQRVEMLEMQLEEKKQS